MKNESNLKTNEAGVLLPCPFCGGEVELINRGNAFTKKRSAEIRCNQCSIEMIVGAIHHSLEWCEETITAKWNRRNNMTLNK